MPCRSVNPFQARIYDREEGCADWGGNAGFSPKNVSQMSRNGDTTAILAVSSHFGTPKPRKRDEIGQKGMSCSLT